MGLERRRAVWEALRGFDRPGSLPLLDGLEDEDAAEDGMLPNTTRQEEVLADYQTSGLSLEAHPLHFERERLARQGVLTAAAAAAAPEGLRVRVAGIVLTRQRPSTAHGIIFLTIEDETGSANIIVRQDVWQEAEPGARRAVVQVVQGRIQRRGAVVHILATKLEAWEAAGAMAGAGGCNGADPSAPPPSLPRMSRDFC